jgi:hypothetical protein
LAYIYRGHKGLWRSKLVQESYKNGMLDSAHYLTYSLNLPDQDDLFSGAIKNVYQKFVEEVEPGSRKWFLEAVVQDVRNAVKGSAALLPFIYYDPDAEIVRPAVFAYLKLRQSSLENPLIAIEDILSFLTHRDLMNKGAVYAGLICFGDRRVCSAARGVRDLISAEEARSFSLAVAGPLQRATAEFCLTWLVDLSIRKQYEILVNVASAVSSMVAEDPVMRIRDTQFNFGPFGFVSNQTLPEITLSDLLTEMMPILDLLAEQEVRALDEMITALTKAAESSVKNPERRKAQTRRNSFEHQNVPLITQLHHRAERRYGQRRLAIRQ